MEMVLELKKCKIRRLSNYTEWECIEATLAFRPDYRDISRKGWYCMDRKGQNTTEWPCKSIWEILFTKKQLRVKYIRCRKKRSNTFSLRTEFVLAWDFSTYLFSFLFFSKTNCIKTEKYRVSNNNTYGPNIEWDVVYSNIDLISGLLKR